MGNILNKMLRENPLINFSIYSQIQVNVLRDVGNKIKDLLDKALEKEGKIENPDFQKCYGLFWLWVLGAFEVTRTMESNKECFSPAKWKKIKDFKVKLIKIRAPFAKQQYAGKKESVKTELSVSGFDFATKDMYFKIEGKKYFIRPLIQEFDDLIDSIKISDIISPLPNSKK